jgi:RNA polymerase sigma factor (sigma-70 family)
MEMSLGPILAAGPRDIPVSPRDDDATLMARFAAGDGHAFEQLYRRHRNALYRYIVRLVPGRADADEIFQEVWLGVMKSSGHYVPAARFTTFLFTIAHRRVADRHRRGFRRPETPLSDELADGAGTPESLAVNAALGAALVAAIDSLPREQRETFLLRAEAGLPVEEIAEITGVPRETAKSRLRYANRLLRAKLDEWK